MTILGYLKRLANAALIVLVRDAINEAMLRADLREELKDILGDSLFAMKLEDTSRKYPGLVGVICPETA